MNRMDERVKGKRTEVLELEFGEKYGSTTQAGKRTISMQDGVAQWPFVVLVPVLEATSSSDHVPWSQLVCVFRHACATRAGHPVTAVMQF